MNKVVVKFGGAALEDSQHIDNAAHIVKTHHEEGHKVVVVVSALLGETDRLEALADQFQSPSTHRDIIRASGEMLATGLFASALEKIGLSSVTLQGWQVPIVTSDHHGHAMIQSVDGHDILSTLDKNIIPVIAGFQGRTASGRITTLGRGGSDLTAIAIAHALNAKTVYFYKDVPGIFTGDPRIIHNPKFVTAMPLDDLIEQCSQGAKILHPRALELAKSSQISLNIKSFKHQDHNDVKKGTCLETTYSPLEHPVLTGVVKSDTVVMASLTLVHPGLGSLSTCLSTLADHGISIDMLLSQDQSRILEHNSSVRSAKKTYTTPILSSSRGGRYLLTCDATHLQKLGDLRQYFRDQNLVHDFEIIKNVAKISVVGSGLRQHPKIFSRIMEIAAALGIKIFAVSTSEIRVTLLLSESYASKLATTLHQKLIIDS